MAHDRITHLRLCAGTDWDTVQASIESLVAEVAAFESLQTLRLLRVADGECVLVSSFADAETLESLSRDLIDPWIEAELGPLLREPASSVAGEVTLTLARADDDEWAALEALEGRERLDYFVRCVAGTGSVWGLYDQTWARSARPDGAEALPFWAHLELAARCIGETWASFAPRRIELEAFTDQWLGGMEEDGIVAVISPTPHDPGAPIAAAELASALRAARSGA